MSDQANINNLINKLDGMVNTNHGIRNTILAKLLDAVEKTDIDFQSMSPRQIEVYLSLASTADGIMKNQEAAAINNVRVNLQKKSEENDAALGKQVTALFNMINPTTDHIKATPAQQQIEETVIDAKLEEVYDQACEPIREGELEETVAID